MNPQPRRQRGEKAVHDRLYHAGQVSLQKKEMKKRAQELQINSRHKKKPSGANKEDTLLSI